MQAVQRPASAETVHGERRRAFDGADVHRMVAYGEGDRARLLAYARIIRDRMR